MPAPAAGSGSVVADRDGSGSPSWMRRRLQDLSPYGAATAGVLTHLPGLVYLAALNAIAESATGTLNGMVQVLVLSTTRSGPARAIVALVLSIYRPTASREQSDRALWARAASTGDHRGILRRTGRRPSRQRWRRTRPAPGVRICAGGRSRRRARNHPARMAPHRPGRRMFFGWHSPVRGREEEHHDPFRGFGVRQATCGGRGRVARRRADGGARGRVGRHRFPQGLGVLGCVGVALVAMPTGGRRMRPGPGRCHRPTGARRPGTVIPCDHSWVGAPAVAGASPD
jgi:hypothetical protein